MITGQNGIENTMPVYDTPLIPVEIMEIGQQELTKYPISFGTQVLVLIKRAFLIVSRDKVNKILILFSD